MKRLGRIVVAARSAVLSYSSLPQQLATAEEAARPVADSDHASRVKVLPGIDVLAAGGFAQLAGLRIGLLTVNRRPAWTPVHMVTP